MRRLFLLSAITLLLRAQTPPACTPLQRNDVIDLLAGPAANDTRILQLVKQCGVGFTWSTDVERDLREHSAPTALLDAIKAKAPAADANADRELEFWRSIKDTNDPALFTDYLHRFPDGLYRTLAEARLRALSATPPVATASATPQNVARVDVSALKWEFVPIAPGSFTMGIPKTSYLPGHSVAITKPFEMARCEVSQAQWEAFMNYNHSTLRRKKPEELVVQPVTDVSWEETQTFIAKLNEQHDGYHYRLPTEAEWEYVASTGTNRKDYRIGSILVKACGTEPANKYGIYDLPANADEWVNDWYGKDYYRNSPTNDPQGPAEGTLRMIRGANNADLYIDKDNVDPITRRNAGKPNGASHNTSFRIIREKQ